MRRFLWIFLPTLLLLTSLSFLWRIGERKLAEFAVRETKELIKAKAKWDLGVETLKINLAPPGLEISNVNLTPETPLPWIKEINVNKIFVGLDFLNLLAGQIKLSMIHIVGFKTSLSIKDIPSSNEKIELLPIKQIFDALEVVPVKLIFIERAEVGLVVAKARPEIKNYGDILLQAGPQMINYGIKATLDMGLPLQGKIAPITVTSKGTLKTKALEVNTFEIASQSSKIGIQGEFVNFSRVINDPHFSGVMDLQVKAEDLFPWFAELGFAPAFPIRGQIKSQGRFDIEKWESPKLALDTEIEDAALGTYNVGSAQAQVEFKKNQILTEQLSFRHPSGSLKLKGFRWDWQKDQVEGSVDLDSLNLQKLFQEIHLERIPVELGIEGRLSCKGKLISFGLDCQGQVTGRKLDVRASYGPTGKPIVALDTFSGVGNVIINSTEVIYASSVILPKSKGQSRGTINFETGFTIDFDSNAIDFSDASPIAGLTFEGQGQLKGRTQGNSRTATLEITMATQNFWFDNFGLGNVNGKLLYQKGHLLIDVPDGKLPHSQYLTQLDVNLNESRISGLVESPHLEAGDAINALSRRVTIPFTATGQGRARAKFQGPFALGGLSYEFEGQLNKGDIQGENFDEIRWDWRAKDGNVSIDNNTIQKGKALILVNGTATPTGHLALNVTGNNFKLENSTFLSKYVNTLGGDLNFKMSMSNHILKPDILLEGKIDHTTLGESELPDSSFVFETDESGRALSLDLMGHQMKMELELPYAKNQPAILLVDVQKFDFTDFIALVLGSNLRSDYKSLLTLKLNLQSNSNDLFSATGNLKIDDLYISRGENVLRNSKPISVSFEDGLATLKDFSIRGNNSEITATGKNFSPSNLKLNIGGRIDLGLLQLFTPFLDNMSGPIKGQISLAGSISSPEVYGNIDLHDISLKIKDFAPVFDHIDSHLEFSQKRIIIESVRGSLAGGSLVGDGDILINGYRDVKIDVKAQLRNLQLEVPAHIQSSGNADVVFSGSWFPYVLSGTYRVNQAFIDKDFSSEASEGNLRQSIYLPKNISVGGTDAVVLDLQVLLDKKVEIKNPQMSGFLTGQIQVKGPPQSPILLGSIKTLPRAQLFFRDKAFDIQSGLIKFTDPLELNPELYFTARSLVDKYEVNLILQGNSKDLQLSMTSQPPLPEADIISLLALGVTSQKLDSQIQSNQQAAQTGYQLGTAIISANPLNKEIKQSLGVDVKFSSGFDDTKNVALPRVTVSKDIIPRKLNASATSSFSENQRYDVRFQYLLNEKLSTVVTYEKTENQSGSSVTGSSDSQNSIFGLDLEYKVEFK